MSSAAKLVHGESEGIRWRLGPDEFVAKATSLDDHFSVIVYESAPHVPGPPLHVHHSNEEFFYILEGKVEFSLDGSTCLLGPGASVLVPKGKVHTFANTGGTPARWVGVFAPGRYQGLIEELGAVMPVDGPPDPAAVAAVFARWDTEIAGV